MSGYFSMETATMVNTTPNSNMYREYKLKYALTFKDYSNSTLMPTRDQVAALRFKILLHKKPKLTVRPSALSGRRILERECKKRKYDEISDDDAQSRQTKKNLQAARIGFDGYIQDDKQINENNKSKKYCYFCLDCEEERGDTKHIY